MDKLVEQSKNLKSLEVDYSGPPILGFEELMSMYSSETILDMDEILLNKATWTVTYQNIWDIMKYGFEKKEVRESIIHFRLHTCDEKVYSLQLRHFLSNMIMWYVFVITDSVDLLDESYIFNFKRKTQGDINRFIEEKIVRSISTDRAIMSVAIDEIVYHICAIAKYTSILACYGLSIYNIHQTAKQFPEIEDIMFNKPSAGLQPNEMESELKARTERLIEIIGNSNCDLAPIFNAGGIMSKGQFQEVMVMIGYKSDLNGMVIPYPIMSNILCDGIATPADFLINSISARKSQIFTKNMMSIPGLYSKKVTNNTAHVILRKDHEMCDSTRPLEYSIDNETELLMLNGRYYYDDQDDNKMKCLDGYNDKHLIGRKIKFRSPETCNSKEGVCKYCYGELYNINSDLASAGAYSATKETEYLGQRVLKTKHVQQTNSEVVEFNEEFNRDFEFATTDIILKDSGDVTSSTYLMIDELLKEDADDESAPAYFCKRYSVLDVDKNVLYDVVPSIDTKLYLSKQLTDLCKSSSKSKDIAIISFDDIDPNESLFEIEIGSAESIDATARVKDLINNKNIGGCKSIDELSQKMMEAKIQSDVTYDCVHHEMVIRALIRKKSNIYEFPDFGPNGDHDDYQILSVGTAMYNTPSPLESLRCSHLGRQLIDHRFFKKTAVSPIDALFAPSLGEILPSDHNTLVE